MLCASLLVLLFFSGNNVLSQILNVITVPETLDNVIPVVSALENATDIQLYCYVNRTTDGAQRRTRWSILRNGTQDVFLSFHVNGTPLAPFFENFIVKGEGTFHTNLTILKFNNTFDHATIGCGSAEFIVGKFNLRILYLPLLRKETVPQPIIENAIFSFNIESTSGYPLLPQFNWYYNNVIISPNSTNPNISVYPHIIFSSVSRSHSGNYSMIVSNEGGDSTGYFILDVQYGPEGITQSGPVYIITNNDVIITSYTNISGNPVPLSNWIKDGGSSLSSEGRFNIDILGQLMITSVLLSDAGHYNNTLENTVVNTSLSISNIIELVVVDPPTQPHNVSIVGNPGPTTVNLTWHNPASFGTSLLSLFTVMLNPSTDGLSTIMINYTAANTTDNTFINSVMVTGLYPNTEYSVTVRAYSTHNVLGLLASNSSTVVIFNTTSTAPEVQSVTLTNVNGNLTVKWTFIHTGGIPLDNISISCRSKEGTNITLLCESECTGQSISVGPVTAGSNYTCIITATNSIGSDMMNTNSIIVITGIPSQPIISLVLGDPPGQATLYIYTMYSGITDVSTFQYIITVLGINQTIITVIPQSSEFNGVSINATIELELSPGRYQFTVISSNVYGDSIQSKNSSFITVLPRPFTTTTSPQPTDRRPSILSDGVIAGIIISIVILLILIIIVILTIVIVLIYKVSSTKQRRGETSPVIKEFFSVKNEAYGITKRSDQQSSIDVTENVAYSTLEQQTSLINPPVYETINQDNSKTTGVYDDINDYV